MSGFAASVETEMKVGIEIAFLGVVPIDLTTIFTGYGPLPAVTGVEGQTGGWDAAGQTRTVRLSDGSSAREHLDEYRPPSYFGYTVSGFTGILGRLAASAKGEWWFTPLGDGRTHVKWRYAFQADNRWAAPALWLITNVFWRGYMRKSLEMTRQQIEKSRT